MVPFHERLNLFTEMMQVDDDLGDSVVFQMVQRMFKECLAVVLNQRLGDFISHWPEHGAQAGCQYHCLHPTVLVNKCFFDS